MSIFICSSPRRRRMQLTWRCSVCRRKMSSRVCLPQDSTDSLLDVPMLETLQRRHSDVKLGSSSTQLSTPGGLNLMPPKGQEIRRHSDVSPASLKELEKVCNATPVQLLAFPRFIRISKWKLKNKNKIEKSLQKCTRLEKKSEIKSIYWISVVGTIDILRMRITHTEMLYWNSQFAIIYISRFFSFHHRHISARSSGAWKMFCMQNWR